MDIDTDTGLETKDGLPVESVVTHAEMMRAFEEFKLANDARTAHMERRSADVLLDEKLTRIDRTIDAKQLVRVRIWLNHPRWANRITIGVG
ncbi:MAG: hypothetical protein WCC50_10815 [Pseudolabrys sp.]